MEVSASVMLVLLLSCLTETKYVATPPPAGDWTVQDDYGNTCMRLSFAAQYIVNGQGFHNHVVNIQPSSYASSKCASPTRFVDFFPDDSNNLWKLELGFTLNVNTNSYAMTQLLASWPDGPMGTDPITEWTDRSNFLENHVTIGKAYTCADQLTVDLGDATISIWDMHLQPFAEDSGGGFGPERPCGPEPTKSDPTVIIVSCSVVGGVVLLGLVVTTIIIVVMRHRKRHAYTGIQG